MKTYIKSFFICLTLLACSENRYEDISIYINNGVKGNHAEIENAICDAVDFVADFEGFDREVFRNKLTFFIWPNLLHCHFGSKLCSGLYVWPDYDIYITWNISECRNSLIHELYHHASYVAGYTDGMWGGPDHGPEFTNKLEKALIAWRKERNCPLY